MSNTVTILLLGKEGSGKSTYYKKITDKSTETVCSSCLCARASSRIHHKMRLVDPSSPINQSSITCEPYNAILIAVEFHPRVASRMVDDFWKAVEKLKYEYLSSAVLLITKLDWFESRKMWSSINLLRDHITEVFDDELGSTRIVFFHPSMEKESLAKSLFEKV